MLSKEEIKVLRERLKSLKQKQKKIGGDLPPKTVRFSALRYAHLGLEFAGFFLGGLFLGNWGDEKLGTTPILTLGGLIMGFFVAMRRLILIANEMNQLESKSPKSFKKSTNSSDDHS